MITDQDLAALDQAERAATPGPWINGGPGESGTLPTLNAMPFDAKLYAEPTVDELFIALSRNSMRDLLDEVRLARATVEDAVDILTAEERMPHQALVDKLRGELVAARDALHEIAHVKPRMSESVGTLLNKLCGMAAEGCKRIDDTLGDG